MKKKTTKQMSFHEMAVRLCEGGEVFFEGYWLKAIVVPEDINPCDLCRMDCVCQMELITICAECDGYERCKHLLYFANGEPPIVTDSEFNIR